MPPESGSTRSLAPVGELHERRAAPRPARGSRPRQVEVAPVDQQVVADGQLGVEAVLLRHHAEAGTGSRARRRAGRGRARAARRSVTGDTHPIMRIVEVLPAPFGPRNPNASPGCDAEVDAVDRDEVAEALREAVTLDQRWHGARRYRRRAWTAPLLYRSGHPADQPSHRTAVISRTEPVGRTSRYCAYFAASRSTADSCSGPSSRTVAVPSTRTHQSRAQSSS